MTNTATPCALILRQGQASSAAAECLQVMRHHLSEGKQLSSDDMARLQTCLHSQSLLVQALEALEPSTGEIPLLHAGLCSHPVPGFVQSVASAGRLSYTVGVGCASYAEAC